MRWYQPVDIYTHGVGYPRLNAGGWGAVIDYGLTRTELSDGTNMTTEDFMSLRAIVKTLKALPETDEPFAVTLHTQSNYVYENYVNGYAYNYLRHKREFFGADADWRQLFWLFREYKVKLVYVRTDEELDKLPALQRSMTLALLAKSKQRHGW